MKFLQETSNIITDINSLRAAALELEYFSELHHPELLAPFVCEISQDVSKISGVFADATQTIISQVESDADITVQNYKTYIQYNTSSTEAPYVHTDHFLLTYDEEFPVNYIGNLYLTPSDVQEEASWFEFFEATNLTDSATMEDYYKLSDSEMTSLSTKTFEYNKLIAFDSTIPHRNAPISTNYWGTNQSDSPLCFAVFMNV